MEPSIDLTESFATEWEKLEAASASEGTEIVLNAFDTVETRDAALETFVAKFDNYQHMAVDLSIDQVTSLSEAIVNRLPSQVYQEDGPAYFIHVVNLEASLFSEIANDSDQLIPSLNEEADGLTDRLPCKVVIWVDHFVAEMMETKTPEFWDKLKAIGRFTSEDSIDQRSPYETLREGIQKLNDPEDEKDKSIRCIEIAEVFAERLRDQEAMIYYHKAIEYQQIAENPKPLPEVHHGIGDVCSRGSDFYQAVDQYKMALKAYLEREEVPLLGDLYRNLGLCFANLGNRTEALKHFTLSNSDFEAVDGHEEIGKNYRSMASLYERKGNLEKAIEHYERAAEAFEKENLSLRIATSYQQIGAIHQNLLNYPAALIAFERALENAQISEDEFLIAALEDSVEQMKEKKSAKKPTDKKKTDRRGFFGKLFGG